MNERKPGWMDYINEVGVRSYEDGKFWDGGFLGFEGGRVGRAR